MTILRKRNIHKGSFPRKQEFLDGVQDCLAHARDMFPDFDLHLSDIPVVFVPNGYRAGAARWVNKNMTDYSPVLTWNLEFSVEAIAIDWEEMYLDTIPHEVAHIVSRFLYGSKEGSGHGPLWKSVAKKLGCTANRTHRMHLTKAHNGRRAVKELYVSNTGAELHIGPTQHKRLQNGYYNKFWIKATGEEIYAHNHVP
jgi:hypothetical protein